ncbi:MAG: ribonuclease PH [Actinobacteria bacterium]|nr:ribonuclease PH [Actinomycetota bacterium]MCB9389092.1 ribonuclease PH [Acidimicrobiia bacterium]
MRNDGRRHSELRPVSFSRDFTEFSAGSVLVTVGRTRVLCTASVESDVPRWMRGRGTGWVTAEYSLLPGSTQGRSAREAAKGKQSGRTQEIQRLVGRSLRAVIDLEALGECLITVDCDVLQADGGTRTASICGGFVALHDACTRLLDAGIIAKHPIEHFCTAVSVGTIDGSVLVDLDYSEDSNADVDMNIVMSDATHFIEVQGTAEGGTYTRAELDDMLDGAQQAIAQIFQAQSDVLASPPGALPDVTLPKSGR